ncbi:MAG: trimeric intracellular cation channel family protein [Cohaesibacteraceae bacterium]|nr:trimeric intracellular cation channel family protein [Cohaesibacteraceae bacterium]MBL4877005.1 trimeric intracellular cation channel family protein [Cohaesibacteraceae bacterium]
MTDISLISVSLLFQSLDLIGVAVFAATGALAASRNQLDPVAFMFFAAVTGLGGGTLRDVLLGITPVFWISDTRYVVVCVVVAVVIFLTGHLAESRYRLLLWADAVGMAGYSILGAAKALSHGASPLAAIIMGLMTASFGGILRDVIAGERSVILRKEIYITAAAVGAGLFVALVSLEAPYWISIICGTLVAFGLRAGALWFGWTLPSYKHPPAKTRSDE